ncbi:MAG: sigma-70 family RNA polymerase sigma factor [Betaproteobacteria bacterium]|nr:sigma-70 family RNA polymerase sigma factor [Betaproteobacteria bacterium]
MEDLLRRIAGRDEAALEQLYRQMAPRVYAFAQRRLENSAGADEVVSETFFEVWRQADKFRGEAQASTWILGIARHKLLDKLRKLSRQELTEWDEEALQIADPAPETFERIAARQRAEHIAHCLGNLPPAQRECMHLVFFEGLALADVATLQQCPENTVKTRLFHARRKMRDCLERRLEKESP